jgi:hypothetical protein
LEDRSGLLPLPDGEAGFRCENLNDEAINRNVDGAYRAKYAGQGPALRQAVSPQVRAHTMRITPP